MIRQQITIRNKLGLHARAAAKLVQVASRFTCAVRIKRDSQEVNAKSILGLLLLAATPGTVLTLICEGADEADAAAALTALVEARFDEDKYLNEDELAATGSLPDGGE